MSVLKFEDIKLCVFVNEKSFNMDNMIESYDTIKFKCKVNTDNVYYKILRDFYMQLCNIDGVNEEIFREHFIQSCIYQLMVERMKDNSNNPLYEIINSLVKKFHRYKNPNSKSDKRKKLFYIKACIDSLAVFADSLDNQLLRLCIFVWMIFIKDVFVFGG